MPRVLIADDNKELAEVLGKALKRNEYQVEIASDGEEAISMLKETFFDLLITDVKMPKVGGIEVLKKAKEISPSTIAIVMTAYGTVTQAVEAMKEGALDYILKPFSFEEIEIKLKKLLEQQRLGLENEILKESIRTRFGPILGNSGKMAEVHRLIDKVASTNVPVLILGKSGTGKELVAREIHNKSPRKNGAFVAINCVALADGVMESELFGHERGSFTGAVAMRRGKFEIANGGTLFLDEIGELSEETQIKLLRFLQDREFQRVGGNNNIKVDVRVLTATNRDIKREVEKGRFREDLFYRLNTFTITLPLLKERGNDLFELTDHFLLKYNKEFNKNVKSPPEALAAIKAYDWPGNVRELENVIAQAVIMADGDILEPSYLPFLSTHGRPASSETGISSQIGSIEQEMIRKALEEAGWNQVMAAKKLGLKRTSLQYKMQKYGLKSP